MDDLLETVINEEFTVPVQSPSLQVSIAVGCATRDRTVAFASTFATFFTRAFDQIRMAAISESNINLCGSHCGVSIGKSSLELLASASHSFNDVSSGQS